MFIVVLSDRVLYKLVICFYYNRFSTGDNEAMGRFRIQLLLADNTRSTRCNMTRK